MTHHALKMFITFQPHSMLTSFLNFCQLTIQMAILVKCKEWTKMTTILGARSKRQTSRMISTLRFVGQGVWVI
jgi:hypothetical protein